MYTIETKSIICDYTIFEISPFQFCRQLSLILCLSIRE